MLNKVKGTNPVIHSFERAIQAMGACLFEQDLDLKYTWIINPPAPYLNNSFLGKTDQEVFGPMLPNWVLNLKKKTLETGFDQKDYWRLQYQDTKIVFYLNLTPLRDKDQKIIGIAGQLYDITSHIRHIDLLNTQVQKLHFFQKRKQEIINILAEDLRPNLRTVRNAVEILDHPEVRSHDSNIKQEIISSAKNVDNLVKEIIQASHIGDTSTKIPKDPKEDSFPWKGHKAHFRKILIIEDNKELADTYQELFSLYGWKLATAYDGEEGISLVKSFAPDLIILDWGLPKINGIQVAQKLRADSQFKNIKIIGISGYCLDDTNTPTEESLIDNNLFDYNLTKPIDFDHILNIIQKLELEGIREIEDPSLDRPPNSSLTLTPPQTNPPI